MCDSFCHRRRGHFFKTSVKLKVSIFSLPYCLIYFNINNWGRGAGGRQVGEIWAKVGENSEYLGVASAPPPIAPLPI